VIHDQRTMTGSGLHTTSAEVREVWQLVAVQGFREAPAARRHELLELDTEVEAYVSDSRWVADCPTCGGGIAAWPEHDRGCCLDCGSVVTVMFPPAGELAELERVLLARPRENRHWRPGETVADLKVENVTHGYRPAIAAPSMSSDSSADAEASADGMD
jgi:hypothetical protein